MTEATYRHRLGVDVFGIDLSPEMIAVARRTYPDLQFEQGSMTALDRAYGHKLSLDAYWMPPRACVFCVLEQFYRMLRQANTREPEPEPEPASRIKLRDRWERSCHGSTYPKCCSRCSPRR